MSRDHAELTLRCIDPASDGLDIAIVLAIMVAHEREFCEEPDVTRATLIGQLTGPSACPELHRVALLGDVYVGAVLLECDEPKRDVFIDVYTLPGSEDHVREALIAHGIDAARDLVPDRAGWTISSGCVIEDAALSRALSHSGFVHTRTYWRMVRDVAAADATLPAAPHGVRLEVASSTEQRRQLHRTYLESFADHYGFTQRSEEEYLHRLANGDGPTPERWWIALDGDEAVGLCIQDDSRAEFGTAWVRTLGVTPAFRSRGIAKWLLKSAFSDAASRGMREIGLTVDSDNSTGATRLYESVGMRSHLSIGLWERPLDWQ